MGRRIRFVIGLLFFVTAVSAKIQLPSVLADGMEQIVDVTFRKGEST